MRFYDYRCTECGNIRELYENTDADKKKHNCPDCEGIMVRKISASSFRVKKGLKLLTHSQRRKKWASNSVQDKMDITF